MSVWSICAGDPPENFASPFADSLHERWDLVQAATILRRQEDIASCAIMGAQRLHFPIPDCIYRLGPQGAPSAGQPLYTSEESLWGDVHPDERYLVEQLSQSLEEKLPQQTALNLVCPLALGGHVDHKLVRRAAEALPIRLWYYEDYPYALQAGDRLDGMRMQGWEEQVNPITQAGLDAWIRAVAAHASQISTFWHQDSARRVPAVQAMQSAITAYARQRSGVRLWRQP